MPRNLNRHGHSYGYRRACPGPVIPGLSDSAFTRVNALMRLDSGFARLRSRPGMTVWGRPRHDTSNRRCVTQPASFAFTMPLAFAMSICPAYLPRSTPITLPMSFIPAAPVSFTAASIAAVISASDICFGR
jgi:hypothetical protein